MVTNHASLFCLLEQLEIKAYVISAVLHRILKRDFLSNNDVKQWLYLPLLLCLLENLEVLQVYFSVFYLRQIFVFVLHTIIPSSHSIVLA